MSVDTDAAKKAEDRLRRSQAHLAEAQRLSHTGSSAFNDTTILYWSEETYRIWGFDPAQGIPSLEAALKRIHPDDRDWVRAEFERAFGEKRGYSIGSESYFQMEPSNTSKQSANRCSPLAQSLSRFSPHMST